MTTTMKKKKKTKEMMVTIKSLTKGIQNTRMIQEIQKEKSKKG